MRIRVCGFINFYTEIFIIKSGMAKTKCFFFFFNKKLYANASEKKKKW